MAFGESLLSARVADQIIEMIQVDRRFAPGDKLPNEFELAQELGVSRTTLREAVRTLVTQGVLQIQRGKGTFVTRSQAVDGEFTLSRLKTARVAVKDLYEMRLIVEPHAAYYAAKRATDAEIERIVEYGKLDEQMIITRDARWDEVEQLFHNAIAKATHNEFIMSLLPMFNRAIRNGIILASESPEEVAKDTLQDHRKIMGYLRDRNAEGARVAMHLHIINTMRDFDVAVD